MNNNVKVYIQDTKKIYINYEKNEKKLPETVRDKLRQYHLEKRYVHCYAWVIVMELLSQLGIDIKNVNYNKWGKPFLNNTFDFNISVSGKYVVVAISNFKSLGVDVEQIVDINIADFRNEFSEQEWEKLYNGEHINANFFTLWTQKESILKAYGTGLSEEMKGIRIENGVGYFKNKTWHLFSHKFGNDLIISVALPVKDYTVEFLQYDIEKEIIENNVLKLPRR